MKPFRLVSSLILVTILSANASFAQSKTRLGDNAALRYWSAFAQMQDFAISEQQAKELNSILAGTAPYDDSKYKDLAENNRPAVETMARGTTLPTCDWGIEYGLREEAPVDFVRKALTLGRLNTLFAFHLMQTGDQGGAVRTLADGMHFSRDVANGGSLFATVVAKDLLAIHLGAMDFLMHSKQLSASQTSLLRAAVADSGSEGVDWQSAVRLEMEVLNRPDWHGSGAVESVTQAYTAALKDPALLPKLQQAIASAPQQLRDVVPNPQRVLEEQKDLHEKLARMRSRLQ